MVKFYKHRTIERFTVGRFEFNKHILKVEDADVPAFEHEFDGLHGVDQANITEVLNVENERPVGSRGGPKVIRGSASSMNTTAGLDGQAKSAALLSQEEALREKELDLARREQELNDKLKALGAADESVADEQPASKSDAAESDEKPQTPATPPAPRKLGIGGLKLGPAA